MIVYLWIVRYVNHISSKSSIYAILLLIVIKFGFHESKLIYYIYAYMFVYWVNADEGNEWF